MKSSGSLKCQSHLSFLIIASLLLTFYGCSNLQSQRPDIKTDYQAVFLDNGQVFFGKLENAGSDYPLMKEVFYVQNRQKPETKEVISILIKRGQEWHGPDKMYINAKHIVVIEPVSPESKVAQLIKEAKETKKSEQ